MPLTINTNIASIQSERALAANRGNMETAMQRLSSGKRINSALDDASGLAVANRMRNQIEGLNMAIRNASDGISLAQTAEGAMEELQNVLLRMRELAVQASNGTYTDTDRSYIAAEFDELMKELRRVSNQAAWDQDIKLIAEGAKSQQVQVGIEAADYIEIPLRSLTVEDLNLAAKKGVDSATGVAIESFKFHQYSNNAEPAVAFVPASVTASDGTATAAKSSLTDVQFIDSPLPNFELRLWNGARDADGNPEGIDSAVNVLSVSGAASVQDLIARLKAHPNYDATSVDIKFEAGELKLVWKIAGQPDPASSLVVTNPVDKGAAVSIAEGTLNKTFSASALITPPGDATDYPDYYQQDFDLSNLTFHRDTIPKSSGNFFSIQIGNRVLTADNATDVSDLAEKLKGDSDYNFIRDSVGLGSSKIELFDVLDIAAGTVNASGLSSINQGETAAATNDLYKAGAVYKKKLSGDAEYFGNVSGRSIDQSSADATTGEIYLFSAAVTGGAAAVYKIKGAETDVSSLVPADRSLLTNALSSSRVQKLRVNFGEDSTDRASLYQSSHKATITNIESAINALDMVDAAAKVVNESRARMGATMSRIEYTINNLMNLVENTEEAKSRVLDTDYAKESAELAKAQILAQAGTAMLAQANQSQQYVLNLLRQG
jgi:flagellin